MPNVDVLIPTCNRRGALAITLAGLASQSYQDFDVVISDQSDDEHGPWPELEAVQRILAFRGHRVRRLRHLPRRGIAEQRHFLLQQATAPYVLFLDDDVFMESQVLERLVATIERERCGFVGAFPAGLTFLDDVRPDQQAIEFWDGPVRPEAIDPDDPRWQRSKLHSAANVVHAARGLPTGAVRTYKVVWVGACCLYDRAKLDAVGGFGFWEQLPPNHAGEEVLVQLLLQRTSGGCALIPSDTYHLELPTTVPDRQFNAVSLLPERLHALGLDDSGKRS